MGNPQTPSPSLMYPQSLQLKLYKAFIFSVPVLLSIVIFHMFYLCYLKRRSPSSEPPLPLFLDQASPSHPSSTEKKMKVRSEVKLPIIVYDEDALKGSHMCCVCLGEYEIKEELHQLPSCKHVFHVQCIRHWLRSNSTCPLCRCTIFTTTKTTSTAARTATSRQGSAPPPPVESNSYQQEQELETRTNGENAGSRESHVVVIEGDGSIS